MWRALLHTCPPDSTSYHILAKSWTFWPAKRSLRTMMAVRLMREEKSPKVHHVLITVSYNNHFLKTWIAVSFASVYDTSSLLGSEQDFTAMRPWTSRSYTSGKGFFFFYSKISQGFSIFVNVTCNSPKSFQVLLTTKYLFWKSPQRPGMRGSHGSCENYWRPSYPLVSSLDTGPLGMFLFCTLPPGLMQTCFSFKSQLEPHSFMKPPRLFLALVGNILPRGAERQEHWTQTEAVHGRWPSYHLGQTSGFSETLSFSLRYERLFISQILIISLPCTKNSAKGLPNVTYRINNHTCLKNTKMHRTCSGSKGAYNLL